MKKSLKTAKTVKKLIPEKKECPGCEKTKIIKLFYVDNRSSDGRTGKCKRCLNTKSRINYRKRNK